MGKAISTAGISLLLFFTSAGVMRAQNEESFVRETTISKRDAVLLSALFPGLGQMTAGSRGKGVGLFFTEAVSLVVFVNAHENYSTKLSTYNRDKEILDSFAQRGRASDAEARKLYNNIQKQSDKLDDLNRTRNIALYIAAGVYAYNLFDAVFLTSTSTESKRAESRNAIVVQSALVGRKPGILISKSF